MEQENSVNESVVEQPIEVKQEAQKAFSTPSEVHTEVGPKNDSGKENVVPIAALHRERDKRIRADEEKLRLNQRIQELEAVQHKYVSSKDEEDFASEYEKDLDVDPDKAKKLSRITQKQIDKAISKLHSRPVSDPVQTIQTNFIKQAEQVRGRYQDWPELVPIMEKELSRRLNEDGILAYDIHPEVYALNARSIRDKAASKLKQEVEIDRENNSAISQSESSTGSKRSAPQKVTPAVWAANRHDKKWRQEHRDEINALLAQNKLT